MIQKQLNKLLLISLLLIPIQINAIEIGNKSHAVNFSGRHRAYTQKILKEYAMLCLDIKYNNPKERLKEGINTFEDLLYSLIIFNKDQETAQSMYKGVRLWIPIKELLYKPVSKENAEKLAIAMNILTENTNRTTALFAKQTGIELGLITNYSGQQRVLSQKMASLYLLKTYGVTNTKFQSQMDHTMQKFSKNLRTLIAYKKNTDEIKKLLQQEKKAFIFFKIMNKSNRIFIPTLIYKKSNEIFKAADRATRLYAESN